MSMIRHMMPKNILFSLLAVLAGLCAPLQSTTAAARETSTTRIVTTTGIYENRYYSSTLTTTDTSYIKPGITPTATPTTSFISYDYDDTYSRFEVVFDVYPANAIPISDLTWRITPTTTGSRSRPTSTYGDDTSTLDEEICRRRSVYGCITLKNLIIILATVIPSLFLLGFVESYFWFRRLMHGQRALRVGTVCWVCISVWVLCFTRVSPSRGCGPEETDVLKMQWAVLSGGQRLKLWLKWGFRHKYPVELLGESPYNNGWTRRKNAGPLQGVEVGMAPNLQASPVAQVPAPQQAPVARDV